LLRKNYEGKEPVFDLARIESTRPDGTRETFTQDGKTYYALVPAYTKDGGHLNKLGRKKVAEQLLLLLVSLSN
jgi:lysophospholipase L1-like esterase